MLSEEDTIIGVRERVYEFLDKYGDKGYMVLKSIIDLAKEYSLSKRNRYGDFDYRGLVLKLKANNVSYNPSQLLRILEDYGIIETTHHSGNQHWWRIINLEEVEQALLDYTGSPVDLDDPEIALVKIQVESLELDSLKNMLNNMLRKNRLSEIDKRKFRRIVFEELELIVKVLKKALEYEDVLESEVRKLRETLSLALMVAKKIGQPAITRNIKALEALAYQPEP